MMESGISKHNQFHGRGRVELGGKEYAYGSKDCGIGKSGSFGW